MPSTIKPKLIDTTYYSIGFPKETDDILINRENYLSQIDDLFQSGVQLIFLEGEEDSGKTTLCSQYARRQANNAITVFFNPLNNLDYSINFYCTNIVLQLQFILGEEIDENGGFVGKEAYQEYIFHIRKKCRSTNKKITLIIDGVENKLKEKDDSFVSELISMLPIGHENINIIISGSEIDFKNNYLKSKNVRSKSISIAGLSEPEVSQYLNNSQYNSSSFRELFKITKGFPGRIKTLKRILNSNNYSWEQIIESSTYKGWIELDCENIDLSIKEIEAILSLFSLSDKSYTIDETASILELQQDVVGEYLNKVTVLESSTKFVSFISSEHKRYYSTLLKGNLKIVQERLIRHHANSLNAESLIALPKLYWERNDCHNVIQVLNEEYSRKLINSTESISHVSKNLAIGLLASEKLKQFSGMYRYSLEGSMVNQLDNFLFWESEVKARIAINDFKGAISLAETAILKIDRLRLLALISRRQKEINNQVDEDLANLINQLYNTTDFSSAGEKIYDIVADLIYAMPNLAIEMIEKTSGETNDKNINDWIIAKLSIAAIDSSIKEQEDPEKSRKIKALHNLNSPEVKKINRAVSFLVGNYSASKVIDEVKKMSDSTERLRLLRLWLTNFRGKDNELGKVINLGLDEVVAASSKIKVNIDLLRELSDQLHDVTDKNEKDKLIYRFKQIENNLTDPELTRNRIIYELNLFHAEYTLDRTNSVSAIEHIIRLNEKIPDNVVRLEGYAEIYSRIKFRSFAKLQDKVSIVYRNMRSLSEQLFDETASHYELSKHAIKTIGKNNPVLALKIIEQVNMQWRREKLRHYIADSYLTNSIKNIKIEFLNSINSCFEDESSWENLCINTLERFSEAKSLPTDVVKSILPFFEEINRIRHLHSKLYAYVRAYIILSKNTFWRNRLLSKFKGLINQTYQKIESDWEKIDIGFSICADISKIDSDFAKEIFDQTKKHKDESWIDSSPVAETYILSIKLVIQAFSALVITEKYTDKDEKIIAELISRIPSQVRRLSLWTEFGFHAYLGGDINLAKRIHDNHILALLDGVIKSGYPNKEVIQALTFIHIFHSDLVTNRLKGFGSEFEQKVYFSICEFYITNQNPFDIFEEKVEKFVTSYASILKAVDVLKHITIDQDLYWQMVQVIQAVQDNKNISRPQISELLQSLEGIVASNLPDKKNIKHDGYKILAEAKINAAKRENVNLNQLWINVKAEADLIPNRSDRIFVKSILLRDFQFDRLASGTSIKVILFEETLNDLKLLKSDFEFIRRVIDITDNIFEINKKRWKEVVNEAFSRCNNLNDGAEQYKLQEDIIDTIYKQDIAFAKELIKKAISEKSEFKHNTMLEKHYDFLQIADKIKKNITLDDKEKQNSRTIVRAIIVALKAINSFRIQSKKVNDASAYFTHANKLSLHEAFPIYHYYLANCAKTYRAKNLTGNVAELHRENFEKAVKSTNLIELLSYRKKGNERRFRQFFIDEDFSTNALVHPNSREDAFQFIKSWMVEEVKTFLIIADPYFEKEDLELLKLVGRDYNDLEINILGSIQGVDQNVESSFRDYWKILSDEDPPFTNITFCWVPDLKNGTPFHDRWVITDGSGLRLGTSINSIGLNKESEISVMKPSEALKIRENTLSEYIARRKSNINGMRIIYKSFSL